MKIIFRIILDAPKQKRFLCYNQIQKLFCIIKLYTIVLNKGT